MINHDNNDTKGFGVIELIIILVVVIIIGVVGYLAYKYNHKSTPTIVTTNSKRRTPTNSSTATTSTISQYTGWYTYKLPVEKLSFKYPADWTVKSSSSSGGNDLLVLRSSNGFTFDIQDGVAQYGSDPASGNKVAFSQPVVFTGHNDYIVYTGHSDLTGQLSTSAVTYLNPPDKYAYGLGGKYINIAWGYNATNNPPSLNSQTVLNNQNFMDAKLAVESMIY